MTKNSLPRLITFDGEARSGKGTVVQGVKDYLRDEAGYKVMLIDAGQVFRTLVVAATRAGIDLDNPSQIDAFLADETSAEHCVELVKAVYHMAKSERDALLYTNQVGENSAKIGARPLSQQFKDLLLEKWLRDARTEGFDVVLLDGRSLEAVGDSLERQALCEFILGLYFVCDPVVGARRTLGWADTEYDELPDASQREVDELVRQINERNRRDQTRSVQPIAPPTQAPTMYLPDAVDIDSAQPRPMVVVDTSATMSKSVMIQPVARLAQAVLMCRD